MNLTEARNKYNSKEIDFPKLERIFWETSTEKQKEEYLKARLWDRPLVIMGKSEKERDQEWNKLTNNN